MPYFRFQIVFLIFEFFDIIVCISNCSQKSFLLSRNQLKYAVSCLFICSKSRCLVSPEACFALLFYKPSFTAFRTFILNWKICRCKTHGGEGVLTWYGIFFHMQYTYYLTGDDCGANRNMSCTLQSIVVFVKFICNMLNCFI